jgi:tRNA A37 threonylcarbamoyladenosine modification protein TsaB
MATILNIETSTEICSVSIALDGKCIDVLVDKPEINGESKHGQHSKILAVLIRDILEKNNLKVFDVRVKLSGEFRGSVDIMAHRLMK